MKNIFKQLTGKTSQEVANNTTTQASTAVSKPVKRVLVIDSDKHCWKELFDEISSLPSHPFSYVVEQNEWPNISVTSYSDSNSVTVYLKPNKKPRTKEQGEHRQFTNPDIVLVRKLVQGLKKHEDYTNSLLGFMHCNTLAVNSFQSILLNLHRPVVYGELMKLRNKYGKEKFPLIDQYYYSEPMQMTFYPTLPIVLKVGTAEAGYGKVKVDNSGDVRDVSMTITRYNDFVTAESFIKDKEYDVRIQKIGDHYRAYQRLSSNWKGNVGSSILKEIPITESWKFMADVCSKEMFDGGMDILTVDLVHTKEGKDYILEINDCASGLYKENELEDMRHIRDIVVEKLMSKTS